MDEDTLLLTIAVVAVLVSAVGVGFTYYNMVGFQAWLTGFATDTATANVTITSAAAINFTTDNIDWGSGAFPLGVDNVTLATDGSGNSRGNWTNVSQGFILENIGNINISINISTDNNSTVFIGGTADSGPLYQYNVTNSESGTCDAENITFGTYYDANTTTTLVCGIMRFEAGNDELRIDLKVRIPSDSSTGARASVMTATTTPA